MGRLDWFQAVKTALRGALMLGPNESFSRHWHRALRRRRQLRRFQHFNVVWPSKCPLVSVVLLGHDDPSIDTEALSSLSDSTWHDMEILAIHDRFASLPPLRGKYVLYLNAADRIDSTYIENSVYLLETVGVDLIIPVMPVFGADEEVTTAKPFRDFVEFRNRSAASCYPSAWMFRRSALGENHADTGSLDDGKRRSQTIRPNVRFIAIPETHHARRLSQIDLADESRAPTSTREDRRRQAPRPVVRNPFANLDRRGRRGSQGRLNLLLCVPWLDNYGSTVLLSNVFGTLVKRGISVTVVATNSGTERYAVAGAARFLAFTQDCFSLATCLPEGNKEDFLSYVVRNRAIDVLMSVSSQMAYDMLPRLRRENPKLRVIDHLYNIEDHLDSNRRYADQIDFNIVANDDVRNELLRRGERTDRIEVIPHGIDSKRFVPGRFDPPRNRGGNVTFGFVGRLSEEKRPLDFVEIARRFPQFRFVMVGEGALQADVEEAIRNYDISDRIRLLGYQPTAEVVEVFDRFDVLVVPSRKEGLPLVLLEAMALRKPVVAARVGRIGQVIEDGVNGFIYPSGDPEALAQRVQAVSSLSSADWLQLGLRARRTIEQEYDLAGCADRYLEAFQRVLRTAIDIR